MKSRITRETKKEMDSEERRGEMGEILSTNLLRGNVMLERASGLGYYF